MKKTMNELDLFYQDLGRVKERLIDLKWNSMRHIAVNANKRKALDRALIELEKVLK